MSVSTTNQAELFFDTQAGEWPITKATVYNDQAEIKRSVTFKPEATGLVMVTLKGLPETLNPSSVRADIPSKNARLLEVFYDVKVESGKVDEALQKEIQLKQTEINKLNKAIERLNFKKSKLTVHQDAILKALSPDAMEDMQVAVEPSMLPKISSALQIYEKTIAEYESQNYEWAKKLSELYAEKGQMETKLNKLAQSKTVRQASVLIELPEQLLKKEAKPVELELFYIVRGAYWRASYDIRVEKGEQKVGLTYFGEVTNSTQENWVEVDMSLSTAKPSVGGALPPLPRQTVDFASPNVNYNMQQMQQSGMDQARSRQASISMAPQMMSNFGFFGGAPGSPPKPTVMAPPAVVQASVDSGDSGSTLFKIQRLANIDSDNKPHRQTIALVQLDSLLTHAASPKVSKDVYLKMSTKNESAYPFLPGQMSVFMDGSFINNSEMELVRPNEEFALFLGIDDNVKLNYSPEAVKKAQAGGGVMGGKKRNTKIVSREITVTNISPDMINLCIYEQVPLSKEGKIKVELKKPDIKRVEPGVNYLINSFNNLETRTQVDPNKKFTMEFEYSLEWPDNEEIELIQKKL